MVAARYAVCKSKMCSGNFQPRTLKQVISAQALYATNSILEPMSNGGAEPNSPRHRRRSARAEGLVQYIRDETQHVGQVAVVHFVFEVSDDNLAKAFTCGHDTDCFAPISRKRPG